MASKKHHYIPQFYLNGFTDANNQYFVYDKVTGKCWKGSPINTFAENHRNTGEVKNFETGETFRTDFPEEMLSYFDGQVAPIVKLIRNSKPDEYKLTVEHLLLLRMLILSIFWRSPVNDDLRKQITETYSMRHIGWRIIDKNTNLPHLESEELIQKMDVFRKLYSSFLPMASFHEKYANYNSQEWRIYYRGQNFHIVTDKLK